MSWFERQLHKFLTGNVAIGGNATIGGTLDVTALSTLAHAHVSDLTAGRVVITATGGELTTDADLYFSGSTTFATSVESTNLHASALTSGGVVIASGTKGQLTTDTDLTFSGSTLTATILSTDTISEKTGSAGVTIDSVTLKDGFVENAKADGTHFNFADFTAAGSTQSDAVALSGAYCRVSGADGTKGARLPAASAVGDRILVINYNSSNALKVYPASGDQIAGAGGTNLPITVNGLRMAYLISFDGAGWSRE